MNRLCECGCGGEVNWGKIKKSDLKILFYLNSPTENLGVQYIITSLKLHGYNPDLIIEPLEDDPIGKAVNMEPHVIGFSSMTGNHTDTLNSLEKLKSRLNFTSIVGGHHVSYFPETITNPLVDIIAIGEAEHSMIELLEDFSNHTAGFWIKKCNRVFKNPPAKLPELTKHPDRELVYSKYPILRNNPTKTFMLSRGCPFSCTFCFNKHKNDLYRGSKVVRYKTQDFMLDEIEQVVEKYPLKTILFEDSTFTLNHRYLKGFLPKYKKRFPGIKYLINARFDSLNEGIVKLLKDTGCDRISLGVETGNEHLRNTVLNKQVSNRQIIKGSRLVHKYGIRMVTNTMYGIPDETLENSLETIKINRIIKPGFVFVALLQPYPKTEIYNYCIEKGLILPDFQVENIPDFHYSTILKSPCNNRFINFHHLHNWFIKIKLPDFMMLALTKVKPNSFYFALFLLPTLIREIKYKDAPISVLLSKFFGGIMKYRRSLQNNNKEL